MGMDGISIANTGAIKEPTSAEYANRTEYVIEKSELKRPVSSVVTLSNFDEDVEVSVAKPQGVRYLFTTKTCPNCKMVSAYLDKAGINYVKIDAEEQVNLTVAYGVKQAPTLVVVNGEQVETYIGVGDIRTYIAKCAEAANA